MPTTRRRGHVSAAPGQVWQVVSDPRRLPEWWPRVERVQGVDRYGFTQLLRARSGALVRADFRRGERVEGRSVAWSQELQGTAAGKVFERIDVTVELEPADDGGTWVAVTLSQTLRGSARIGWLVVRRAARRTLDEALRSLAALLEADDGR